MPLPSSAGGRAVSPSAIERNELSSCKLSAESRSGGAPRSSSRHSTSALRTTISPWPASQAPKPGPPSPREILIPATNSSPAASRRTPSRGPSITMLCRRSSPYSSERHATTFSIDGSTSTSRPCASWMRTSDRPICGRSPSQPARIAPTRTGSPIPRDMAATIGSR